MAHAQTTNKKPLYIGLPPKYQWLTLTYSPTKLHPRQIWARDLPIIMYNLQRIAPDRWKVVPEMGEEGNFHWHALLYHNNFKKLGHFRNYWFRTRGFHKLKPVKNDTKNLINIHIYMRKENSYMRFLLKLKKPRSVIVLSSARHAYSRFIYDRITRKRKVTTKPTPIENQYLMKMLRPIEEEPPSPLGEMRDTAGDPISRS